MQKADGSRNMTECEKRQIYIRNGWGGGHDADEECGWQDFGMELYHLHDNATDPTERWRAHCLCWASDGPCLSFAMLFVAQGGSTIFSAASG